MWLTRTNAGSCRGLLPLFPHALSCMRCALRAGRHQCSLPPVASKSGNEHFRIILDKTTVMNLLLCLWSCILIDMECQVDEAWEAHFSGAELNTLINMLEPS